MRGYKLPEIEADIVSTSHNYADHNNINLGFIFAKVDKFISAARLKVKEYDELELNIESIVGALSGIEYAVNLTTLDLDCYDLEDIKPLRRLTSLTKLRIMNIIKELMDKMEYH